MHYVYTTIMVFFLLFTSSLFAEQSPATLEINSEQSALQLTEQELAWIQENRSVTMIGDASWFPFEGFDENGKYLGIVAEILNLITEKSGLNFEVSKTASWLHSVQFSEDQQVDIISASASNPILEKNYRETYSTIKSPIVIIARETMQYIPDLTTVKDLRVALIGTAGYSNKIKQAFPEVDFIEIEEISEALVGVAEAQFDVALMSMTVASYQMAELGLYELRIAGITELDMELTLFVNRNEPVLWSIIDKIKRHESKQERHEILSRWVKYKYVDRYSSEMVRLFIMATLFLIAFILYRNYLLKKQTKLLTKLSQRDKLTNTYNRLYLGQLLSEQVVKSQHENSTFSLIMVDIDAFKKINNKYGYQIGDKLLQHFSLLIKDNIRHQDMLGRWGDRVFIVICPDADLTKAHRLAENLRQEISQAIFLNVGKKTACLGVVEYKAIESWDSCLGRLEASLQCPK
ncbi:hypothetical protein GCM10007916_06480 [Psychromonas marina]|uniref:diguanylate cyclase n=1 Tax=Psychromonas marina TaxID=88364 RepID=A0ABQ6DXW0_9GAMM|nr:GGDEF domain-containing protein [Psychromonas marina]GLS89581.1 hypothetical protein GCM10007916_06480 [Psychromonas marina]